MASPPGGGPTTSGPRNPQAAHPGKESYPPPARRPPPACTAQAFIHPRRRPKYCDHSPLWHTSLITAADLRRVWLLLVLCTTMAAVGVAHVVAPNAGPWTIVWAGVIAALCAALIGGLALHRYHARSMPAFGMLVSMGLGLAATGCALLRLCVETPYPRTAASIFLVAAMFVLTVLQGKLPPMASMAACWLLLPCLLLLMLGRQLPASCPDPCMQAAFMCALKVMGLTITCRCGIHGGAQRILCCRYTR